MLITISFPKESAASIFKVEDSTLKMVVADFSKTLVLCNHKIDMYSVEHINVFIELVSVATNAIKTLCLIEYIYILLLYFKHDGISSTKIGTAPVRKSAWCHINTRIFLF